MKELEELIGAGGHADLERTQRVHKICAALRGPHERALPLRSIEDRFVQLYSQGRHAEFPGGAEGLRSAILADVAQLRVSLQRAAP